MAIEYGAYLNASPRDPPSFPGRRRILQEVVAVLSTSPLAHLYVEQLHADNHAKVIVSQESESKDDEEEEVVEGR